MLHYRRSRLRLEDSHKETDPLRRLDMYTINSVGKTIIGASGAYTYEYLLTEGVTYTFTKPSSSRTRYVFSGTPFVSDFLSVTGSVLGDGTETTGTFTVPVGKPYLYFTYAGKDSEKDYLVTITRL